MDYIYSSKLPFKQHLSSYYPKQDFGYNKKTAFLEKNMNLEEFDIIIFATGIVLGCIATIAVKNAAAKKTQKVSSNTDTLSLKSLQQELNDKQAIIDTLFINSNEQLVIVEKRLSNLRNTLSESSKQLSHVVIESDSTQKQEEASDSIDDITPPRDYAPKTDKEPGMLSETFGLDETKPEIEEPKRGL